MELIRLRDKYLIRINRLKETLYTGDRVREKLAEIRDLEEKLEALDKEYGKDE